MQLATRMEAIQTTFTGTEAEPPKLLRARLFRPCNIYRDVFGGWRWEFKDRRGHMRDSTESFDSYEDCAVAAHRVGFEPQVYVAR